MKLNRKLLTLAASVMALSASTPAFADGNLFFLINGDTFTQPFSITNNSTAGEFVTGFGFNLAGTGLVFDPIDGGAPGNGSAGTPFTPVAGSGITTGLVNPVTVVDGSTFFSMNFTNFGVGKSFSWLLDVDPAAAGSVTVLGNQLIGSSIYVDFSNGLRGTGSLLAVPGSPNASQLTITTFTPIPAVPEPATWAMMLIGFAAVGSAMRAKFRKAKALAA
jgi:hypothetical protein